MKRLLNNILIFFIFPVILIAIIMIANSLIVNSSSFWRLPNNEEYIVLGHSHPECAFNDSIIPNFVNLGSSSEAYLYSYTKLIKVIESNSQLKAIFVELGTNNINEFLDTRPWDEIISEGLPQYYPIMERSDMRFLCKNNFKSVLHLHPKKYIRAISNNFYSYLFEGNTFLTSKRKFGGYGGYLHLIRNETDSLISANELNNGYIDNQVGNISETNIFYLNKILELSENNGIKAFLIRTPVHELYSDSLEENLFQNILRDRFPDTEFLDFEKFPLKNHEYGDFGHLNYIGAEKFSKWFAGIIEKDFFQNVKHPGKYEDILLLKSTCL